MSAADPLAVLMTGHLHYDWDEPRLPVNDHRIFSAGQQNLHLTRLAVSGMPGSGSGEELLAWAGVGAPHIAAAARELVTP